MLTWMDRAWTVAHEDAQDQGTALFPPPGIDPDSTPERWDWQDRATGPAMLTRLLVPVSRFALAPTKTLMAHALTIGMGPGASVQAQEIVDRIGWPDLKPPSVLVGDPWTVVEGATDGDLWVARMIRTVATWWLADQAQWWASPVQRTEKGSPVPAAL
jgi:hypothetical protein